MLTISSTASMAPPVEEDDVRPARAAGPECPFRVLYYYGHQQFDTGSPKALVAFIDLLDRSRFEPVFLATGQGPLLEALERRNVEIVPGQVSMISLRKPLTAIRRVRRQARVLRKLGIDLVHVADFSADLDLVLGAWWANIPVVLHMQNPATVGFRNLHRFAASKVLLCSENLKADVAGFARIQRKAEVLPNVIDLDTFAAPIRPPDQSSGPIVCTVAQVSHRKGIDIVLDAARRLLPRYPGLQFWIVGRAGMGEEAFASAMQEEAARPEYGGRVKFLGSRSDVPAILRDADIFFFPTRAEPFGIAVIEAMATGLPVVASRTGGIKEILCSPEYGIAIPQPASAETYADALVRLLDSSDRGRALGEAGRASLVGRFDKPTLAARLNQIYTALLSRGSALRRPARAGASRAMVGG